MSETIGYWVCGPGDARAAAATGRRYAYRAGFIGLRVLEVTEQPNQASGSLAGMREFRVTMSALERRVGDQLEARKRYYRLQEHRQWPAGSAVRANVPGIDYSDGRRHTMPAGSVGVIASRVHPNFRVTFVDAPGRAFLYAPQDLELAL
jgi:hypothetical protein